MSQKLGHEHVDQKHDKDIKRHGSLEIEENIASQRRLWKVQKVVRILTVAILLLAFTGIFGGGPLSTHEMAHDSISVKYQRIAYRDTPQTFHIKLANKGASPGTAQVWIASTSLEKLQIKQIVPQPQASRLDPGRTLFEFSLGSGTGTTDIFIEFESRSMGMQTIELGLDAETTFHLKQFFLP